MVQCLRRRRQIRAQSSLGTRSPVLSGTRVLASQSVSASSCSWDTDFLSLGQVSKINIATPGTRRSAGWSAPTD